MYPICIGSLLGFARTPVKGAPVYGLALPAHLGVRGGGVDDTAQLLQVVSRAARDLEPIIRVLTEKRQRPANLHLQVEIIRVERLEKSLNGTRLGNVARMVIQTRQHFDATESLLFVEIIQLAILELRRNFLDTLALQHIQLATLEDKTHFVDNVKNYLENALASRHGEDANKPRKDAALLHVGDVADVLAALAAKQP